MRHRSQNRDPSRWTGAPGTPLSTVYLLRGRDHPDTGCGSRASFNAAVCFKAAHPLLLVRLVERDGNEVDGGAEPQAGRYRLGGEGPFGWSLEVSEVPLGSAA